MTWKVTLRVPQPAVHGTGDGRATLKHELAKLAFADGIEWAQDDVSGVELDSEIAKRAREVEMIFF